MSERFLCGDSAFFVNLVMDDLVPLHCIGVHFFNSSNSSAVFTCVVATKNVAIAFDRKSDQVWNLPSPVLVTTTVTFKGGAGWSVAGLTSYAIRQGGVVATGALATDIPGMDVYANATSGVAHNAAGGTIAVPGTITHNAAPA